MQRIKGPTVINDLYREGVLIRKIVIFQFHADRRHDRNS